MEITKDDALIIVQLAEVAFSEGIGPDYDSLLKRIEESFSDVEVPARLYSA